jgi:hypothetical protein
VKLFSASSRSTRPAGLDRSSMRVRNSGSRDVATPPDLNRGRSPDR